MLQMSITHVNVATDDDETRIMNFAITLVTPCKDKQQNKQENKHNNDDKQEGNVPDQNTTEDRNHKRKIIESSILDEELADEAINCIALKKYSRQ